MISHTAPDHGLVHELAKPQFQGQQRPENIAIKRRFVGLVLPEQIFHEIPFDVTPLVRSW